MKIRMLVTLAALALSTHAAAQTAPAAAEAPASLADFAKNVQNKLGAVRKPAEAEAPPFQLSHFVKPPPPPKTEEEVKQGEAPIVLPPEIKCQGVMNLGAGLVVVINSGSYKVGDTVLGAKITRITQTEVWFNYRNKQFKLPAR